jgi:hypothetical protein
LFVKAEGGWNWQNISKGNSITGKTLAKVSAYFNLEDQIFQKFSSHLQFLSARMMTR